MITVEHSTVSAGTWLYITQDGRKVAWEFLTSNARAELIAALSDTARRGTRTEVDR